MTVCNMAIEGGARAGLIAPDEKLLSIAKAVLMPQKALLGNKL